MKSNSHSTLSRWLIPIAISLLAVAVLRQKSENPLFFSRYNWDILLLFFFTFCWAIVAWWIALTPQRSERMFVRLEKIPLGLPAVFVLFSLFLLDFCTPLLDILTTFIFLNFILLMSLGILLVMLTMAVLSTESPRIALQNVTLVLFSVIFALFCAEVLFRGVLVEYRVPRSEESFQELFVSSWPRPVSMGKPSETFRILGLADSFGTNGGRKNYHYLLEEKLQREDSRYDVVNLSRSAYELPEERELFLRFGSQYQPNLVIHGVFVGNDFWGDPDVTLLNYRGISLSLNTGISSWRPGKFLLRQWLRNYVIMLQDKRKKMLERHSNDSLGGMSHSEFLRVERQRLNICHKSLMPDANIWNTAAKLLDQIHNEATRVGAKYVIVIHPDQFQVEQHLLQELGQTFQLNPALYDLKQPQRFLLEYCRSRDIPCLDLLPVFQEKGKNGGLYLLRDTHYNNQGNQLAADTIAQFLRHKKLLQ